MHTRASQRVCVGERGSNAYGAGLRLLHLERKYVVEGDLLEVPAAPEARFPKRRGPIGLPQTHTPPPTPLPSLKKGTVLSIFPFSQVGITEIVFFLTFELV